MFNKSFRFFKKGNLPDFLIIGTQKSGTSSLFKYLDQFPNLQGSSTKEIHYFDKFIDTGKDINWYKDHFIKNKGKKNPLYFEATPNYIYHKRIPKLLYDLNPELKFIVILREPVSRAYSSWNMYREMFNDNSKWERLKGGQTFKYFFEGRESFPSFKECLDIELDIINNNGTIEPSIIRRGFYSEQLKNWFEFFPKNQFTILDFDEFKIDLVNSMRTVSNFLDVPFNMVELDTSPSNKRNYVTKISSNEKLFLQNLYLKHNLDLEELLDRKFNW